MKRAALVVALALAAAGCAGGTPLLHPAHVLPQGDVRAVAGLSGQAIVAGMNGDIRRAQDQGVQSTDPTGPPTSSDYTKGAMVASMVAPGLAPVIGARVGAGGGVEGGIMYLGRGARLDIRKAFSNKSFAVSIGAGLDIVALGRSSYPLPYVDMYSFSAFGFDVPVIVGWRSTAGLYQVWGGVRGGYDHASISQRSSAPAQASPQKVYELSADHGHAGALLGIAIGLKHIHVALELDANYVFLTGTFNGIAAKTSGLVLTPGSAVSWDF